MPKTQTNGSSTTKSGSFKNKSLKGKRTRSHQTLDDLFEEELKDIYNAEKQLIEALPEMAKAAYNEDLEDAFNNHLEQTQRQAERIEKIFTRLDIDKDDDEQCEAMEGLIKESNQIIEEFEESPVRDSALIIAAQKIEHYEIAAYGSLRELAEVLGYLKIAEVLDRTLEEEEITDKHLTAIAQNVNDEACELIEEEELM